MSTPTVTQWVTGIGRRTTPLDVQWLLSAVFFVGGNLGWGLRSGDAIGADRACVAGAELAGSRHEIYCPTTHKCYNGNCIAADRLSNFEQAKSMAFNARGSFHGLKDFGILLQARTTYQVLGPYLNDPSRLVVLWSPLRRGGVEGGTNTAYQLALQHGCEIWNLATPRGLNQTMHFLTSNPYFFNEFKLTVPHGPNY